MSRTRRALVGGALLGALAGCGGGASSANSGAVVAAGAEPTLVITDQTEWDGLMGSGKAAFDKACGNCHPGGEADLGPKLSGLRWSVEAMTKQIRNGSGRMKPINEKRLPEADMRGLMVYLSSIGGVGDVQGP